MKTLHRFLIISLSVILSVLPRVVFADNQLNLIPEPVSVEMKDGYFTLNEEVKVKSDSKFLKKYLLQHLECLGIRETVKENIKSTFKIGLKRENSVDEGVIDIRISKKYKIRKEGYVLETTPQHILIKASDEAGALYGIQTLLQLMPPEIYSGRAKDVEHWRVPCVRIEDYPRFSYRGLMLDVSRTFFDIDFIRELIDWMAYHKLNTFHWHLIDDNGWRIEIQKYPALTEKGGWRGPGEILEPAYGSGRSRYGGFYTQKEILEIVDYAQQRNIEIIPEIDLPGHSKALIAIFPEMGCKVENAGVSAQGEENNVICVAREDNYRILDEIIEEIAGLFKSEYIHVGGDEVNFNNWKLCPECQKILKEKNLKDESYLMDVFFERIEKIIRKHGKKMAGWDEIAESGNTDKKSLVYAWRNTGTAIDAVKKGYPTVMQIGEYCYLDMKQSELERGHTWAGIVTLEKAYSFDPLESLDLNEKESRLVVGTQSALWSELLYLPYRFVEYQLWPRAAATAEIGWSSLEHRDYADFYRRLVTTHYDRMYNQGIRFRIDYPEVKYENGKLTAEMPYDWAVIRYTDNATEPDRHSPVYRGEIETDTPENYRFAAFYKDEIRSISVPASNIRLFDYYTDSLKVESSSKISSQRGSADLTDDNPSTFFSTEGRFYENEYVKIIFDQLQEFEWLKVETGYPGNGFYGMSEGYIEYSYNGIDFIKAGDFYEGEVTIEKTPEPIKAIRLVATRKCEGPVLIIRDLKIKK